MESEPLSLRMTTGIPCVKMRSSLEIFPLAAVELTMSTSGNREYASVAKGHKSLCGLCAMALVVMVTSVVGRVLC